MAYFFGIMAGLANSFLDSGTYPALMESFPNSASRANVLIKAFVSAGQFLLPFIIGALIWANMWYGWSFIIAAVLMIISAIYLIKMPFPDHRAKKESAEKSSAAAAAAGGLRQTGYGHLYPVRLYRYGDFLSGQPVVSAVRRVRCRHPARVGH
jgi:MFS family permease